MAEEQLPEGLQTLSLLSPPAVRLIPLTAPVTGCQCDLLFNSKAKVKNLCRIVMRPGYKLVAIRKKGRPALEPITIGAPETEVVIPGEAETESELEPLDVAVPLGLPMEEEFIVTRLPKATAKGAAVGFGKKVPAFIGERIAVINRNYVLRDEQAYSPETTGITEIVNPGRGDVGVFVTKALPTDPINPYDRQYRQLSARDIVNMIELDALGMPCYCVGHRISPLSAEEMRKKKETELGYETRPQDTISYSCYEIPKDNADVVVLATWYRRVEREIAEASRQIEGLVGSARFQALKFLGVPIERHLTTEEYNKTAIWRKRAAGAVKEKGSILELFRGWPGKPGRLVRGRPLPGITAKEGIASELSKTPVCTKDLTPLCLAAKATFGKEVEPAPPLEPEEMAKNLRLWEESIAKKRRMEEADRRETLIRLADELSRETPSRPEMPPPSFKPHEQARLEQIVAEEMRKRQEAGVPEAQIGALEGPRQRLVSQLRDMATRRLLVELGREKELPERRPWTGR